MRGFATDAVLPQGGLGLLVNSLELRFRLSKAISVAAFTDVGNVYSQVVALSLRDLRYVAGLGVRYRTALGPIRVEWAQVLDPHTGEKRGRPIITVGHAF